MSTQETQQIMVQLNKLHTRIAVMETNIGWIRKEIEGNGKPGIITRVCKLENAHNADSGSNSQRKRSFTILSNILALLIASGAVVVAIVK